MKSGFSKKMNALIKDGFAHIFVGTFLNKAITMISSIAVARFVDKEQYAYLGYSDTIQGYILLFSGFGLASAILKVCAGSNNPSKDKGYMAYALKLGLIFDCVVTFVVTAVCMVIDLPFPQGKRYIFTAAFYPIINFVYNLGISYIRTQQKNKAYAWLSLLYSALTCVLSIAFVLLMDAIGLIYARYLTVIVITVIVAFMIKKLFQNHGTIYPSTSEKKQFCTLALSLVVANAFSGMIPYNENMLVSHIIADEEVLSNFRVANLLPQMIILVAQAVNIYYFPIVAQHVNQGKSVKKEVVQIEILNFSIVVICCVVGMLFTPLILPLLYGEKYSDAVSMANSLWIMGGINAAFRMVPLNMLVAIGEHKFNLIMSIIAFFGQFVLDWYFISTLGIQGVVIGAIVVYVFTGSAMWIRFLRKADSKYE